MFFQMELVCDSVVKAKWAASRSFVAADSWLKTLRMVKTGEEVSLLKTIASRTEHGISGSSHHLSTIGGKSEKFQSEDVRVHCER